MSKYKVSHRGGLFYPRKRWLFFWKYFYEFQIDLSMIKTPSHAEYKTVVCFDNYTDALDYILYDDLKQ